MDLFTKIKLFYFGMNKIQQKIFPPVVVLILVFIIVRFASRQHGIVLPPGEDDGVFVKLGDEDIQQYLNALYDTRSPECQVAKYDDQAVDTVSIILDFHESQFYDLKMTLESLLRHTPEDKYKEIIILDDGTGNDAVRNHAAAFLDNKRFRKVKAYRSEKSEGSSLSRFKASKVASGSVLVFISSESAVNEGWLEPLLDAVRSDRHLIAVPHTDSLLSGYRFYKTNDNLINVMDWKMWTLFAHSEEKGSVLKSPVMTGSAFAVTKTFLDSIGSFDESMDKGGGENLELSLRTWLCGGSIKIITCSRIAVRNALSPREIMTPRNFRRIVELWLGSYRAHAYRQGNYSYAMDESEKESLKVRSTFFKKTMPSCDNFKGYLTNVLPGLILPPDDARYFGKIKCKTGYCLTTSTVATSGKVKLTQCSPHMYESDMLFTLTTHGHIRCPYGECLTITSSAEQGVQLQYKQCDDSNTNQKWQLAKEGHFKSMSSSKGLCLHHGIEYSTINTHFLELKPCVSDDRPFEWTFLKY